MLTELNRKLDESSGTPPSNLQDKPPVFKNINDLIKEQENETEEVPWKLPKLEMCPEKNKRSIRRCVKKVELIPIDIEDKKSTLE